MTTIALTPTPLIRGFALTVTVGELPADHPIVITAFAGDVVLGERLANSGEHGAVSISFTGDETSAWPATEPEEAGVELRVVDHDDEAHRASAWLHVL